MSDCELKAATWRDRTADGLDTAAATTRGAVEEGVDVIYQGVLIDGRWRGIADFLERTADGSYEALDTKLAHRAKPAYILQLCFYSEALGRLQGQEPEHMHVLLGSGERQSFRPRDFDAYTRHMRRRLEEFVANPPLTEPTPAGTARSATSCRLRGVVGRGRPPLPRRRLRRTQLARLVPAGIDTLRTLARADPSKPPPGMNAETFARLQRQAALQLARREDGKLQWLLEPLEPERGFALLPAPSAGDLFFDIEGYPFWDRQGSLEYLWGFSTPTGATQRCRRAIATPSAMRSRSSSTGSTCASPSTRTCTSTTTRPTRSPCSAASPAVTRPANTR